MSLQLLCVTLLVLNVSCSSAEVEAPNRGTSEKDNSLNPATAQSGDAQGSLGNSKSDLSESKGDGSDQSKYDKADDTSEESSETKSDETKENEQEDKPQVDSNAVLMPVYKLYTEETASTSFNYDIEKGEFDEVAFVVYAENSVAGLTPLYRCRVSGTFRIVLSNDSQCEGQEVLRKLGYVYKDHNGDNRDYLMRCKNSQNKHSAALEKDLGDNGECSPGYTPEGPLGGTPLYEVKVDDDGVKSYSLK